MENEHMEINWKMFIAPLLILFLFIGGIIGIINWQKTNQKTPTVTVNLPEGTTDTTEKEVIVSGKAEKDNKVWVNGEEVKLGDDGSYSKTVTLNQGENKISVKTENNGKKTATVERTVKYNAPIPTPTAAPATPEKPAVPAVQPAPAPQASAPITSQTPSNLSTSGPEEVIIPVIGAGGIVLVMVYYFKSRKQFASSIRKQ